METVGLNIESARRKIGDELGRRIPLSTFSRWRRDLEIYGHHDMQLDSFRCFSDAQVELLRLYGGYMRAGVTRDNAIALIKQEIENNL
jgi:hypothetical protein